MNDPAARELVGRAAGMVSVQGLVSRSGVPRGTILAVIRGHDVDDQLEARLLVAARTIVGRPPAKAEPSHPQA